MVLQDEIDFIDFCVFIAVFIFGSCRFVVGFAGHGIDNVGQLSGVAEFCGCFTGFIGGVGVLLGLGLVSVVDIVVLCETNIALQGQLAEFHDFSTITFNQVMS